MGKVEGRETAARAQRKAAEKAKADWDDIERKMRADGVQFVELPADTSVPLETALAAERPPAKGRKKVRQAGRPSKAQLAQRETLARGLRPIFGDAPVTGHPTLAKSAAVAGYYGKVRNHRGRDHFESRQRAMTSLKSAVQSIADLYKLGAYSSTDLDVLLGHVIAAQRLLQRAQPDAGLAARIATTLADAQPAARWRDVEGSFLQTLELTGVAGVDDPNVLKLASDDVMITAAALKKQKQRRR